MTDLNPVGGVPPHPALPPQARGQQDPRRGKTAPGGKRVHPLAAPGGESEEESAQNSSEPQQAGKDASAETARSADGSSTDVGTQVDYEA